MVFSSITFIFLYFPLVLAVYHLLFIPVNFGFQAHTFRKLANLWLFAVSIVFYFWGEKFLVVLVLVSSLIDFVGGWLVSGAGFSGPIEPLPIDGPRTRWQKFWLTLALTGNLGLLAYYKYSGFLAENLNHLYAALGMPQIPVLYEALPLGISFYTFNTMSYTIDVYRGHVRATRSFLDFGCFVTMFPHLVAGPIVRYSDVEIALENRVITRSMFALGIDRLIFGLGKKLLIANTVAIAAEEVFALPANELGIGLAWFGLLAYTLQIYFDFSGYSDMAIGMALMLGFEFRENFNYPYSSQSIRDFWRRWHMTLSNWFRDYVYIPLGGNRDSKARTMGNLILVFTLCGLWHGASWNFLLWGLFHGVFLSLERLGWTKFFERRTILAHLYTLLVVMGGWVLFRTDNLKQAGDFYLALCGRTGVASLVNSDSFQRVDVLTAMLVGCVFSFPVFPAIKGKLAEWMSRGGTELVPRREVFLSGLHIACMLLVLFVCTASMAARTHNPFLYFRF